MSVSCRSARAMHRALTVLGNNLTEGFKEMTGMHLSTTRVESRALKRAHVTSKPKNLENWSSAKSFCAA